MSPATRRESLPPLYQQIAADLRDQITYGMLAPGSQLPTETELAEQFSTTRTTVRQGITKLVNESLVVSQRPRGYFVRERRPVAYRPQQEFRKQPESPEMDQFLTAMESRKRSQHTEVMIIEPPAEVQRRLRLSEGDLVAVRQRVQYIDEEPCSTNDSYYPLSLVQDSKIMHPGGIAHGANYVLEELGYEQVRALDEIHIRMPTPNEVSRLNLGPGTPVAIHICTGFTEDGTPVRVVLNCLPGDRHVIAYERQRRRPKLPQLPEALMMGDVLTIRSAQRDDLPMIVALLREAAQWLGHHGLDQWQHPPNESRIVRGIKARHVFLIESKAGPVATVTVDDHANLNFWTEADDLENALYLHRGAVARSAAGHELGALVLDWAGGQASRQGKTWLRLDAWRTNPRLHRYYTSQGFEHVRTLHHPHGTSGVLFQRPATARTYNGPLHLKDRSLTS